MPLLFIGIVIFDMCNLEVDSPPPGMLLFGYLVVIAILTPFTIITGFRIARAHHQSDGG